MHFTDSFNPKFTLLKRANCTDVYTSELTALKFSDLKVGHGHGAENAGETKR